MNRRHPLDEAFRRKLRDLETETPAHLWEQISQERDWKHRVLNQARQKKPVVVLITALVLSGLSWGIWPGQPMELGHFPMPLYSPLAEIDYPSGQILQPTDVNEETTGFTRPSTPASAQLAKVPPAVKNTAVRPLVQSTPNVAPSIQTAIAGQNSPAAAKAYPAVRPIREEALPVLASIPEQQQEDLLSIFDGLFSPDPRCAKFSRGDWNFYLDALLSPDLSFRQLQARDPEFAAYVSTREETESNLYAFSGALRLSITSDKGLSFRTGLNYSQINERFSYINGSEEVIETINNYDQDGNIISTDTIIRIGTRRKITQNQYRMLDIPFLLGYEVGSEKFRVSVNGGAYLNLLFRQKGDFLSPTDLQPIRFDSSDPDAYPAFKQQAGLGWYGSIGLAFQASHHLQLVIEPHFKIFPKSVTRDQYGVQQRYMTTGLFVGVRQRL